MQIVIATPRQAAIDLIRERGWMQGTYSRAGDGVCVHGAIRLCCAEPGDAPLIEMVADKRGRGTDWNDMPDQTETAVLASLATEAVWDVTDSDLSDTFGSQWEAIVALVRRVAKLGPAEAEQLDAAWAEQEAIEGDQSSLHCRGVVWDAAWNSTPERRHLIAARDSAWGAVSAAVTGILPAAGDAVLALAARDLIGQRSYTQEHYDVLTRPWRLVIGPVHPGDR